MPKICTRQAPAVLKGKDWTAFFWARMPPGAHLEKIFDCIATVPAVDGTTFNSVLKPFGFDFSILLVSAEHINLIVGARSTLQLYWTVIQDSGKIYVTDHLPHVQLEQAALRDSLDVAWLHTFMSHGLASGPMEFTPSTRTIYRDWQRVPASHRVTLSASARPEFQACTAFDNISDEKCLGLPGPGHVADFVRQSFSQHLAELGNERSLAIEFSGGIDSGLIISQACQGLQKKPLAICNSYPYPEFRREIIYQESIRKQYGFQVDFKQGHEILPFAKLLAVSAHDEPSVLTTSWGHLSSMHAHCQRENISTLLTGHGGDTLFEISPERHIEESVHGHLPELFGSACRKAIGQQASAIRDFLNQKPQIWVLARHWHPTMLDSAFINRVFHNHPGHRLSYTSGLISPDLVNGLHAYWILSNRPPRSSVRPIQKPVAHEIFGDLLPENVWRRPGKVNHLGLSYRGLSQSQQAIFVLEKNLSLFAPLLEFDAQKLGKILHAAASGLHSGDGWLSRMLALLIWAHARDQASELTLTW